MGDLHILLSIGSRKPMKRAVDLLPKGIEMATSKSTTTKSGSAAKTTRGRNQDRALVAGGQAHEVAYEAKKSGTSTGAVKEAVKKVGNSRAKVEAALKKSGGK